MVRIYTLYLLLFTLAMVLCVSVRAADDERTRYEQRRAFLDAKSALVAGNRARFDALSKKTTNYPLHGYLQYEDLNRRLATAKDAEVKAFLSQNSDSPVGVRLRSQWLSYLADQKRWKEFNENYLHQDDDDLRCYALRARLATGKIKTMMADIRRAWLVPREQPPPCEPVFDAWIKAGGLTEEIVWQRIRLAMEAGKLTIAQKLALKLKVTERVWVERWIRMYNNPAQQLDAPEQSQDLPIAREIVRHGVLRLLRLDVDSTVEKWWAIKPRYAFTPEQVLNVEREIALQAAYSRHPRALDWLLALSTNDEQVMQWRVRAALQKSNWSALLGIIATVPLAEVQQDHWVYWRARALAELGAEQSEPALSGVAFDLFDGLVDQRGYYGFLAADRLDRVYDFNHAGIEFTAQELQAIAKIPGMQRAYELLFLNLTLDARKEWLLATTRLSSRQLQLAAVLAHQWGWHDRAILTMAQSSENDDLNVRFPMAYVDQVVAAAARYSLDPAWVYGVIRQESAFMLDVRSSAGAMGLMQIMPATARLTAKIIKTPFKGNHELLDLDRNINLGSAYLRRLSDQFFGHQVLSTAAYNAGPQRVKVWMPTSEQPADVWIETMPFRETREYVKRVLTYTTIFDQRLDGQVIRMTMRMPVVKPL